MAALSVSDLLKQRESGEITREEFFKKLASLQAPTVELQPKQQPAQESAAAAAEAAAAANQESLWQQSGEPPQEYALPEPLVHQQRPRLPQTSQLVEPLGQQQTQPLLPSIDGSSPSPPLPPPQSSDQQQGLISASSMTTEHQSASLWQQPPQLHHQHQHQHQQPNQSSPAPILPTQPRPQVSSGPINSTAMLLPEPTASTSILSDFSSNIWDVSDNQVAPSAQELLARAMKEARQKLKLESEADDFSSSGPIARLQDDFDGEPGARESSQPTLAWTEDDSPGSLESWDGPYAHHSVGSRSDSSFSAFTYRGQLWELRRSQRAQELRERAEAKEVEHCTFHPVLSTQKSLEEEVQEEKTFNAVQTAALVERLSRPTQPRVSAQTEAWMARREEEAMKDCTFQPNLHRRSSSYDRGSNDQWWRSLSEARLGTSRRNNEGNREPELTFAPQTNTIRKEMVNAQSYLQADVFARLSQVSTAADAALELDSQSSISTTSRNGGCKLDSFFERQRASEERKKSRLESLQATYTPAFRPQLVDRKAKLPGDEIIGKPEKSIEPDIDPECTFRPKITKLARDREGRPVADLGPGDMKRRQERRAKAAEEQRRREAGQLSAPKVNSYNGVQGRLRVREHADTLMERIEKKRVAERARCQKELKSRQEREEAPCSFKPEVKTPPAWISRMAATRRAAREATPDAEEDELPTKSEWR